MADDVERELHGLDADRPLPPALRARLEATLLDDAATLFDGLDAPRPIPSATRGAIEEALATSTNAGDRRGRVLLALAAAVLLVVGSVAALRAGAPRSNRDVAAGPARTVPEAGVPPPLHRPTETTAPVLQALPATPPTRRTTPTTWDCGLCARNGAKGSARVAASATTTTAAQPSGGPQVAAASLAGPQIFSVKPASGTRRGGTIVILTGYGFTGASGVMFGAAAAHNFTVVSDSEIRVMTPSSPVRQTVPVSVTYPDGSATATEGTSPSFTFT